MLNEKTGNIWTAHDPSYLMITTNGFVKNNGKAVMGRGIAREAALNYTKLPGELGICIKEMGNVPFLFEEYKLITFPVKHHWAEAADLKLIEQSAFFLQRKFNLLPRFDNATFEVPRPGCGNGQLAWDDVKPIMVKYFGGDPRFTFWSYS